MIECIWGLNSAGEPREFNSFCHHMEY